MLVLSDNRPGPQGIGGARQDGGTWHEGRKATLRQRRVRGLERCAEGSPQAAREEPGAGTAFGGDGRPRADPAHQECAAGRDRRRRRVGRRARGVLAAPARAARRARDRTGAHPAPVAAARERARRTARDADGDPGRARERRCARRAEPRLREPAGRRVAARGRGDPLAPQRRQVRVPADRLLLPLARGLRRRSAAVAVVLSGTASDGSDGLREIKAAGGIAIAQRPDTAKYDGMPRAAIATGLIDLVLSPEEIAVALAQMGHHQYRAHRARGRRRARRARRSRRTAVRSHPHAAARRNGHRLPAVQAADDPSPRRPAHGALALDEPRAVRPPPREAPARDPGAAAGRPDPRDPILPRSRLFEGLAPARPAGDPRRAPARRAAAGVGRWLLDRRGGLLTGHPAVRVPRRARAVAADPDLRDRRERARHRARAERASIRRRSRATSRRRGCGASSSRTTAATGSRRRCATCALRAPRPHPRPALLAHGRDPVSQPADLPESRGTAEGDVAVPLRAEAVGFPPPGQRGDRRTAVRSVPRAGQADPPLREAGDRCRRGRTPDRLHDADDGRAPRRATDRARRRACRTDGGRPLRARALRAARRDRRPRPADRAVPRTHRPLPRARAGRPDHERPQDGARRTRLRAARRAARRAQQPCRRSPGRDARQAQRDLARVLTRGGTADRR